MRDRLLSSAVGFCLILTTNAWAQVPQEQNSGPSLSIPVSPSGKPAIQIVTSDIEDVGAWHGGDRVSDLIAFVQAEISDDYDLAPGGIEIVFDLGGDDALPAGLELSAAMSIEGYALAVLEGAPGEVGQIVVGAATHRGLFYGANTALDLLLDASIDPNDPVAAASTDVSSIRDYPDFTARAVFMNSQLDLQNSLASGALTQNVKDDLRRIARRKLNQLFESTGAPLTDADAGYRNPTARAALQEFQIECARWFIDWVPLLDTAGAIEPANQEGKWRSARPGTFFGGMPSLVFNPSFEADRIGDDWPEGWSTDYNDKPGRVPVGDWTRVVGAGNTHWMELDQNVVALAPDDPQHLALEQKVPFPGSGTYVLEGELRITTPLVNTAPGTSTPRFSLLALPMDANGQSLAGTVGFLATQVDNAEAPGPDFTQVHSDDSASANRTLTLDDTSGVDHLLIQAYLTATVAGGNPTVHTGVVELDSIRLIQVEPILQNGSLDEADPFGGEALGWTSNALPFSACGTAHGTWSYGSHVPFGGAAILDGYRLDVPDSISTPPCESDDLVLTQLMPAPHKTGEYFVEGVVSTSGLAGQEFRLELIATDAGGIDLPPVAATLSNADGTDQLVTITSPNLSLDINDLTGLRVEAFLPESGHGTVYLDEVAVHLFEPRVIVDDLPAMHEVSDFTGEIVLNGGAPDGRWLGLGADAGFEQVPGPPLSAAASPGWQYNTPTGLAYWSLETDAHRGTASARLTIGPGEVPATDRSMLHLEQLLSTPAAALQPGFYVVSFWAKRDSAIGSAPQVTFRPCGDNGHVAKALVDESTGPDTAWRNYWGTVEITAEDVAPGGRCATTSEAPWLYIAWFGEGSGSVSFDSVALYRADENFTNLREADYAPVVRDAANTALSPSQLEAVVPKDSLGGRFDLLSPEPRLFVNSGTTLVDGDSVTVSFDKYLSVDGRANPLSYCSTGSSGDPALDIRHFAERVAPTLAELSGNDPLPLPIRNLMIRPSELRGLNKSGACHDPATGALELENGALVARYVNLISDEVAFEFPETEVFTWHDMFSPYDIGGDEDYQLRFFGPTGASACSVDASLCIGPAPDAIPSKIGMLTWRYWAKYFDGMVREFSYFETQDRALYGTPSTLFDGELNYTEWGALSRANTKTRGVADFDATFAELAFIAEATWNAADARDWRHLAFDGYELEDPPGARTLTNAVLAAGEPGAGGCGLLISSAIGNETGVEATGAGATMTLLDVPDPGATEAGGPRPMRVRVDLDGSGATNATASTTWHDSLGGTTSVSAAFVLAHPIREGRVPGEFFPTTERYVFDLERPGPPPGTQWLNFDVTVQLANAGDCADNLTVWAGDTPCFDCPPPKVGLYHPLPEPGGLPSLAAAAALLSALARRRRRRGGRPTPPNA